MPRHLRWFSMLAAAALAAGACAGGEPTTEEGSLGFTEVAADVGIDFRHGAFHWSPSADPAAMMGGGLCWIDYDNDGWLDLFVVNNYSEAEWGMWQEEGGLPTAKLYRNNGGGFDDMTEIAGVGLEVRGSGCVAADFDLDDNTDLFVTTARGDVLLWNEGDGTFLDGSELAGTTVYGWHTGAAAGDVNGDGWPDLFLAGYADPNTPNPDAVGGFPNSVRARRDILYLNEGPGPAGHVTFREVGEVVGLESAGLEYGLGAVLSDLDSDGDLDLFVANDTNPNRLYRNDPVSPDATGIGMRFVDVTEEAGVGDLNSGMGVAAEDYNHDGTYDLIVTNLGDQLHSVYRNELQLGFAPDQAGLGIPDFGVGATGWGVSWADFDLDGDRDLMIANGFVPLRGDGDRQRLAYFENTSDGLALAASGVGLDDLAALHGRGLAAADYDNDGDIDVAVTSISDKLLLLENTIAGRPWLTVDVDGFHPGATVTAVLDDGGELRCEIRAGTSWLSSEDPRCHFGWAQGRSVAEFTVRWPDGVELTIATPAADRIVVVSKP